MGRVGMKGTRYSGIYAKTSSHWQLKIGKERVEMVGVQMLIITIGCKIILERTKAIVRREDWESHNYYGMIWAYMGYIYSLELKPL